MTQTAEPAVWFEGVHKCFGAVRAVDGIDLAIPRGRTVALLGRNGAGKSTAISLLLGLDTPDSGTVRLFGTTPERAVARGLVGAMLQDGQAVRRVTVGELVSFVAAAFPNPLPVAEALELAGLTGFERRRVDKLSGGQVQRVRFAVALAGGPELIVLDEPTAALDVEARRTFWASMRAYADRGNTVLFSTHYLEEADSSADRIVVLDHGRIVANGTGAQLKAAAGGRIVSVDLRGGSPETLRGLPGVRSVEVTAGRAALRTDDVDATVVALAGLGAVHGIEVGGASLEDVFLSLTSDPHTMGDPLDPDPKNPTTPPGKALVPAQQDADDSPSKETS